MVVWQCLVLVSGIWSGWVVAKAICHQGLLDHQSGTHLSWAWLLNWIWGQIALQVANSLRGLTELVLGRLVSYTAGSTVFSLHACEADVLSIEPTAARLLLVADSSFSMSNGNLRWASSANISSSNANSALFNKPHWEISALHKIWSVCLRTLSLGCPHNTGATARVTYSFAYCIRHASC